MNPGFQHIFDWGMAPCQTQILRVGLSIRPAVSPLLPIGRELIGSLCKDRWAFSRTAFYDVRPPSCTFAGHSCALHRRLLRLRQLEALQQPVDER